VRAEPTRYEDYFSVGLENVEGSSSCLLWLSVWLTVLLNYLEWWCSDRDVITQCW